MMIWVQNNSFQPIQTPHPKQYSDLTASTLNSHPLIWTILHQRTTYMSTDVRQNNVLWATSEQNVSNLHNDLAINIRQQLTSGPALAFWPTSSQRIQYTTRHTIHYAAYNKYRSIQQTTRHTTHYAAYHTPRSIQYTTRHTLHYAAYTLHIIHALHMHTAQHVRRRQCWPSRSVSASRRAGQPPGSPAAAVRPLSSIISPARQRHRTPPCVNGDHLVLNRSHFPFLRAVTFSISNTFCSIGRNACKLDALSR